VTDAELRAIVRDAIARRMGADDPARTPRLSLRHDADPSHARYDLSNPTEACLIEPAVRCNHCSYCKSHGY
jgi:hypothetical protein